MRTYSSIDSVIMNSSRRMVSMRTYFWDRLCVDGGILPQPLENGRCEAFLGGRSMRGVPRRTVYARGRSSEDGLCEKAFLKRRPL